MRPKEKVKKKIIVLVPRLNNQGGIANYYSVLKPYLGDHVSYLHRGKDDNKNRFIRLISDYWYYYKEVKNLKYTGIVLINSSLGIGGIIRDGIYSFLTPQKVTKLIFFRGWDTEFEKKIDQSFLLKKWLNKTYLSAEHIIVLSSDFKHKLAVWGYNQSVTLETTIVDEKMLSKFDNSANDLKKNEILFLSRIEKEKGIFETVDAINILSSRIDDLHLNIVGNGTAFDELKNYVSEINGSLISLKGHVKGKDKFNCFEKASIFLFPSAHGEGMPNSVLEAMAFGLPIITTKVGGIPDFFEEGKMGYFLDNREPEHISEKIEYLLKRPELMKEISEYNYNYAKEHFYASKVAVRLQKIIDENT